MSGFDAQVFQNEYLPEGAEVLDAVITVTAHDVVTATAAAERIEVLILDCSGSMTEEGGAKMASAKQATQVALDLLPDGVRFAVIGGVNGAYPVYPGDATLAVSSAATRAAARDAVARIYPEGGTAIGSWLRAAASLFRGHPGALAHALLLTDGKNQHEQEWELDAAIAECVGLFQCDCRGLGVDWNVAELRKVATALLGTVDIIPRPEEMADEFRAITESALGKSVANVALRLWHPVGATLGFLRQVAPAIDDLSGKGTAVNELTTDYPLGAWAAGESRDYHLQVRVPPGSVGDERLGARAMLVLDGVEQPGALVRAVWTDDEALSTRINREVAHYTGQAELADAIADGLAARAAGDDDTATVRLGQAVALAHEAGNGDTVKLLERVVEVDDPATGTVRLRAQVEAADEMALDVRSTRTVRVGKT